MLFSSYPAEPGQQQRYREAGDNGPQAVPFLLGRSRASPSAASSLAPFPFRQLHSRVK